LLRRVLLGALVALLVARPAAGGEDPGRLLLVDSISGPILGLGWLLLGLVTSVGRFRFRPGDWGGYTTAALLGCVGLLFAGAAFVARYKHPAYLAAWDGVTVLVAFVLVRQLATEPAEGGRLTAVLLATAVSLALPALYAAVAAPLHWPTLEPPKPPIVAEQQALPNPLRHELIPLAVEEPGARSVFERPDTFAGWLVLLLPAAGAAVAAGWRGSPLRREATLVAAVVLAAALVLTRQVGAVAALALVGVAVAVRLRDGLRARPRLALGLGAAGLAVLVLTVLHRYGPEGPGRETVAADLESRRASVAAAAGIARDHPIVGVGPANVTRYMARHTPPEAAQVNSGAGSVPFQVAAAGGALGLLALAGVLVLIVRQIRRGGEEPAGEEAPPETTRRRNEFAIGGAVGLLGGFLLRAVDLPASEPPEAIMQMGIADAVRAGLWFASFALFDGLIGRRPAPRRALLAGVAAVLLFGLVSDAPLLPALATPLAVAAALALPRPPRPADEGPAGGWLERTIPVTAAVVLALGFVLQAAAPGIQAGPSLKTARRVARVYVEQDYRKGNQGTARGRLSAVGHLENAILPELSAAQRADPADAALALELAEWLRQYTELGGSADWTRALGWALRARGLDPEGVGGLWEEFEIRLNRGPTVGKVREFLEDQDAVIRELTARDPAAAAPLHLRMAEVLFAYREKIRQRERELTGQRPEIAKQAEKKPELLTEHDRRIRDQTELARLFDEQARAHARQAADLDAHAPGPRSRLDAFQRFQVERWLKSPP
jgi:O-antigen ligase